MKLAMKKSVGVVLMLGALVGIVKTQTACDPNSRRDAAVFALDVLRCVVSKQGETDEKVIAACVRDGFTREDVMKALAETRAATEKAAAAKAGCGQ